MIEQAYTLVILALASARLAVLVAHDVILEKPRVWLYRRFPPMDNPMHGYEYQRYDREGRVLPAGATRKWYMISELSTCTRCLTVWIVMVFYFALNFIPAAFGGLEALAAMAIASWGAKRL